MISAQHCRGEMTAKRRFTERCYWPPQWPPPEPVTSSGVDELLDEADHYARQLGRDANHLWTAFGPTNVARASRRNGGRSRRHRRQPNATLDAVDAN